MDLYRKTAADCEQGVVDNVLYMDSIDFEFVPTLMLFV